MKYYPWTVDDDDSSLAWIVKSPDEIVPKEYLLNKGVACRDWFPDDVVFDLSDDYGIRLSDSTPNTGLLLIVSEKLRNLLEERSGADIEFLKVKVRNQKKRLAKEDYYIANVLGTVSCLDRNASDFRMDAILKTQVDRFRRLVLDESKIDPDTKLFRLAEKTSLLIVREDLGLEILKAKCTGMFFQDIDDYGSEWR